MIEASTAPVYFEDDTISAEAMPVFSRTPEVGPSAPRNADYKDTAAEGNGPHIRTRKKVARASNHHAVRFDVLSNWEGVITAVEQTKFYASIRKTNSDLSVAEDGVEIGIDEVDHGDLDLLKEGSIFYLTVGVIHPPGQGRQKTTRLVFRRMPRWGKRDLERADAVADELWRSLGSIESPASAEDMAAPAQASLTETREDKFGS
ncbi:hypothetical protein V5T82_16925 [Magnetovibrio sp. PR-2]|uniref:hypothetical protein n=1 Tax=Magnetovibrio sp. PR-2 TaxID=3120356 RepID=UPI002FCDE889